MEPSVRDLSSILSTKKQNQQQQQKISGEDQVIRIQLQSKSFSCIKSSVTDSL